jgi:hypothetical protein
MALPNMSLEELRRKNEASQQARDAEKRGTAPTGQQQTGR